MSEENRKIRSDSTLDALEEDQKTMLCEWLMTPGAPYRVIRENCGNEFGVWPSDKQLGNFYKRYVGAELLARRKRALSVSDEVMEDARKAPGQFTEAAIEALGQKAFELASAPLVNSKDVKGVFTLLLKYGDQQLKKVDQKKDQAELELRTCETFIKWWADKKAQAIMESNTSNAEKIAALRQTYFADVDELERSGKVVLPE